MRGSLALAGLALLAGCGIRPIEAPWAARVPRVGLLHAAPASSLVDRVEAFRQGLRDVGYSEGQNVVVEYRYAEGQPDRLTELVADLVRLDVNVIVSGGPQVTRVARGATGTLPIVMAFDPDPVGSGFVTSLARPGGNVTGLSSLTPATSRKGVELLNEILPGASRVAVLGSTAVPGNAAELKEIEAAASVFGIDLQYLDVRGPTGLEVAFRGALTGRAEAMFVQRGFALAPQRRTIVDLAARERLPLMAFAEDGGLITYSARTVDLDRRAASYVDKILKGAKPADLPVEQPTTFDFVVNLRTARALGLTIPQAVLLQATEIIQ